MGTEARAEKASLDQCKRADTLSAFATSAEPPRIATIVRQSLAASKRHVRCAEGSGDFLPPSPPGEKATAREEHSYPTASASTICRGCAFTVVPRPAVPEAHTSHDRQPSDRRRTRRHSPARNGSRSIPDVSSAHWCTHCP
jgi:hypothetical protein